MLWHLLTFPDMTLLSASTQKHFISYWINSEACALGNQDMANHFSNNP